ncbi:MAG: lysophospholipid acyltransferase family protein [Alcanivoracaceae bacterium]|nr:lysophospholipid acyltransferase family protein [Alcanivoracaceae bacterium]
MLRALYLAYFWLVFIPALVMLTLVLGVIALTLAPLLGPRAAGRLTGVPWSRFGLAATGVNVRIVGKEHIDPRQSYVIVANHLSHYDIWVLYGYLGIDIRWVAKKELRSLPVVGIACVALGHVFIDRSDHKQAIESLQQARKQIVRGTSIIFFPEGTRSRTGALKPFKKGAFRMARDLELPVLPVTLDGTYQVLRPGSPWVHPGEVVVTIHPPIPASGDGDEAIAELEQKSRAAIASTLAESGSSHQEPASP